MNMTTFTRWVALSFLGMGPLLPAPAVSAAEVNRKAEMPVRPALTPSGARGRRAGRAGSATGLWRHATASPATSTSGIPRFTIPGKASPSTALGPRPTARAGRWNNAATGWTGSPPGLYPARRRLIRKATARLALVVDGVNARRQVVHLLAEGPPEGFNGWAHSQMGRALVAWYEATGEKRVLDALVAAYRDYPIPMGHLCFDNTVPAGCATATPCWRPTASAATAASWNGCGRPWTAAEVQATLRRLGRGPVPLRPCHRRL